MSDVSQDPLTVPACSRGLLSAAARIRTGRSNRKDASILTRAYIGCGAVGGDGDTGKGGGPSGSGEIGGTTARCTIPAMHLAGPFRSIVATALSSQGSPGEPFSHHVRPVP